MAAQTNLIFFKGNSECKLEIVLWLICGLYLRSLNAHEFAA